MKLISLLFLVLSIGCGRNADRQGDQPPEDATQSDSAVVAASGLDTNPSVPQPPAKDPVPSPENPLPSKSPTNQFELDARSATEFVYFKLENDRLIKTGHDQAWQFAVKRTQFQTNSGTSGSLNFGAFSSDILDYEGMANCRADTFTLDTMLPASGAPGSQPYSGNSVLNSWYNYDPSTHAVSSKKLVYLISDRNSCFKFQILSYASGLYTVLADSLEIPAPQDPAPQDPAPQDPAPQDPAPQDPAPQDPAPQDPAPQDPGQTIDASSNMVSVYLKFDQGRLLPSSLDADWHIAVKRTQFQTNSGTSGTRGVGVYNSESTDFAAISSCVDLSYTYDAMLPASGAPGSMPYSGNALLNAWYDYDFTTHSVNSRRLVYVLSDGTECVKIQILGYVSGVYSLQVSQL